MSFSFLCQSNSKDWKRNVFFKFFRSVYWTHCSCLIKSKTLTCASRFELGKTLLVVRRVGFSTCLVVYKIKLIFHFYSYSLHYPFLTSSRISNSCIWKYIDPSRLGSENRVILAWMLTATQFYFSLISVFLLIRFELRTQLYFSLISVFLLIRFELRTQEATQLKMELDKAQETIQAAETLVSKLDGEFKRWSGQVRSTITIDSRV